jgi:hypothetical protein
MHLDFEQLSYQINSFVSNHTIGEKSLKQECLHYQNAYFTCVKKTNPFNFLQLSTWFPFHSHACTETHHQAWEEFKKCYYQVNPNWINYGLIGLSVSAVAYTTFRYYSRNR